MAIPFKQAARGFQSTLPVRGATRPLDGCLCGLQFQSTLPVRGATGSSVSPGYHLRISIHAPREGSDEPTTAASASRGHFNPRSP